MPKAKKLPSGSWNIRVFDYTDDNGRQIFRSFTHPRKDEAEAMAAAFVAEKKARKAAGKVPGRERKSDKTVGEILDLYISHSEFLSPTTIAGYEKIRRNNFTELMATPCSKLDQAAVQAAINSEARTPGRYGRIRSAKSVKNAWGAVAAALQAELNMSFSVKLPQVKKETQLLPEPESVMAAIKDSPAELPCLLAMWLSYSMSEIRGLRCSDVDLDRMTITINQVMVDVDGVAQVKPLAKTQSRLRSTELPQLLAEKICALDNWQHWKATGEDSLLIQRERKSIIHYYSKALEAAGLDLTFHDLRHVFASVMLNQLNMPSKLVQIEGGWSTPAVMDKVYSQSFSSAQRALHAARDSYFESLYNAASEP